MISGDELVSLGCNYGSPGTCINSQYDWLYSSSYWSGSANDSSSLLFVDSRGYFYIGHHSVSSYYGVRPVLTISKSYF